MSYTRLPKETNKLPSEAKEIYRKAFNNAEKFYAENRTPAETKEIASKVAWNAVKRKFQKLKDFWTKKSLSY